MDVLSLDKNFKNNNKTKKDSSKGSGSTRSRRKKHIFVDTSSISDDDVQLYEKKIVNDKNYLNQNIEHVEINKKKIDTKINKNINKKTKKNNNDNLINLINLNDLNNVNKNYDDNKNNNLNKNYDDNKNNNLNKNYDDNQEKLMEEFYDYIDRYKITLCQIIDFANEMGLVPLKMKIKIPFVKGYINNEDNELEILENGIEYIYENKEIIKNFNIDNISEFSKIHNKMKIKNDFVDMINDFVIKINLKKNQISEKSIEAMKALFDYLISILTKLKKLFN